MTYNVKATAAMLKKSQTWVITRCRRLEFIKHKGSYYLTTDDIKKIVDLGKRNKTSKLKIAAIRTGLKPIQVKRISYKCDLGFREDYEKIIKACNLWKTKEYTLKGILKRL